MSFCVWALLNGYEDNLTLDRKDGSKDYSPDNCCWVPMSVQNRNRSQNRIVEIDGRKMCMTDWCKELGLKYDTVMMRIYRGMGERRLWVFMNRLTIKAPSGLIHLKDNAETTINMAIKKLSDYEDFEEIFLSKITDVACEFLNDKGEFAK